MTYIINTKALIVSLNNKLIRIEKTDKRYPKVIKFLDLPPEEQEEYILKHTSPKEVKLDAIHGKDGFEVVGEEVYYRGEVLPKALADKVRSMVREDLPLNHFEKFWDNLKDNPSASAVNELVEFLEYKELPITEDGHFLAYKGVGENYYSIHGNTKTKVIKGLVNDAGQIYNGIGEELEVLRRDVDDDRTKHCSSGLHVGSIDYASSFAQKVVIVKVNPKNVVSVPNDYQCQKCRVSAYSVVADYEGEITSPVVDENGEDTIVTNNGKDRSNLIDKIDTYISNKIDSGWEEVTVRQIQNAMSPMYPSKASVLEALQELGYGWYVDEDGTTVVEISD